jgi:hypothetical protein
MVRLYNFGMPHQSLRQGRTSRTPAMAIGLTDHLWSSWEYSWLPGHADPILTTQMDERMTPFWTPALPPPSARPQTKSLPGETPEAEGVAQAKAA